MTDSSETTTRTRTDGRREVSTEEGWVGERAGRSGEDLPYLKRFFLHAVERRIQKTETKLKVAPPTAGQKTDCRHGAPQTASSLLKQTPLSTVNIEEVSPRHTKDAVMSFTKDAVVSLTEDAVVSLNKDAVVSLIEVGLNIQREPADMTRNVNRVRRQRLGTFALRMYICMIRTDVQLCSQHRAHAPAGVRPTTAAGPRR